MFYSSMVSIKNIWKYIHWIIWLVIINMISKNVPSSNVGSYFIQYQYQLSIHRYFCTCIQFSSNIYYRHSLLEVKGQFFTSALILAPTSYHTIIYWKNENSTIYALKMSRTEPYFAFEYIIVLTFVSFGKSQILYNSGNVLSMTFRFEITGTIPIKCFRIHILELNNWHLWRYQCKRYGTFKNNKKYCWSYRWCCASKICIRNDNSSFIMSLFTCVIDSKSFDIWTLNFAS